MAWIYLAESEDSRLPWRLGCGQLPIVRSTDTRNPFCSRAKQRVACRWLRYGMTSGACAPTCSLQWTSSTADSLARTSALLVLARAWKENALGFSLRLRDSFARFDQATSSWRMLQRSLFEGSIASPPNFPRSGMTVDGTCYELAMWARPTKENAGGFWPTPTARDSRSPGLSRTRKALDVRRQAMPLSVVFKERFGYPLPASFVEYLMGYDPQHTALEPWATQWFRSARAKRSGVSRDSKEESA